MKTISVPPPPVTTEPFPLPKKQDVVDSGSDRRWVKRDRVASEGHLKEFSHEEVQTFTKWQTEFDVDATTVCFCGTAGHNQYADHETN